jgi:hypothetical protein
MYRLWPGHTAQWRALFDALSSRAPPKGPIHNLDMNYTQCMLAGQIVMHEKSVFHAIRQGRYISPSPMLGIQYKLYPPGFMDQTSSAACRIAPCVIRCDFMHAFQTKSRQTTKRFDEWPVI